MQPWIAKRPRLPEIIEAHSQPGPRRFPGTRERSTPPGNCSLPEYFIYCPQAGGVVVGWALRNGGGGGVWPSVMKRYEGVGGGQIYGKNALRNTWMAPCLDYDHE